MKPHPNAAVAGGTTGVGLLIIWLLGLLGVTLSAEAGAAIAGAATTVVLFIGRNGIAGAWRLLLHGKPPPTS